MEQKTVTSHLIKGLIIAVVLMALDYFVRSKGGVNLPFILQLLPTLLMLAGIIGSCLLYGSQTGGQMPRGDIFAHGFKTSVMVSLLKAVYTFIIVKYVFPHTMAEMEEGIKIMMKQGNMLEPEARSVAENSIKKAWIFDVGGAIFGSLIPGVVGSFIGAAFAKKKA